LPSPYANSNSQAAGISAATEGYQQQKQQK
jgi:hypothetical protein